MQRMRSEAPHEAPYFPPEVISLLLDRLPQVHSLVVLSHHWSKAALAHSHSRFYSRGGEFEIGNICRWGPLTLFHAAYEDFRDSAGEIFQSLLGEEPETEIPDAMRQLAVWQATVACRVDILRSLGVSLDDIKLAHGYAGADYRHIAGRENSSEEVKLMAEYLVSLGANLASGNALLIHCLGGASAGELIECSDCEIREKLSLWVISRGYLSDSNLDIVVAHLLLKSRDKILQSLDAHGHSIILQEDMSYKLAKNISTLELLNSLDGRLVAAMTACMSEMIVLLSEETLQYLNRIGVAFPPTSGMIYRIAYLDSVSLFQALISQAQLRLSDIIKSIASESSVNLLHYVIQCEIIPRDVRILRHMLFWNIASNGINYSPAFLSELMALGLPYDGITERVLLSEAARRDYRV